MQVLLLLVTLLHVIHGQTHGYVSPYENANGCSVPLKIPVPFDFNAACCDEHDFCYGRCNSGRKRCDDEFKSCVC